MQEQENFRFLLVKQARKQAQCAKLSGDGRMIQLSPAG
jgi:hypothetical protein